MLKRFTFLEEAVKATIALIGKDVNQLRDGEWKMAHELVKLLKPFENVTKHVCREEYATASLDNSSDFGLESFVQ